MSSLTEYYLADGDGYLRATLLLSEGEAQNYTGLLTARPPDRPAQSSEVWNELTGLQVDDIHWGWVKQRRNELLAQSDWVVVRAADRGEPVPTDWSEYRQALRDITLQADPLNIVWPTPPA